MSPAAEVQALVDALESKSARSQQVLRWVALDQQRPTVVSERLHVSLEAAEILLFRSAWDPAMFVGTDEEERTAAQLLAHALSESAAPTHNPAALTAWAYLQSLRTNRSEILNEQERRQRAYEASTAAIWHERLRQLLILLVVAASAFFYWKQHR